MRGQFAARVLALHSRRAATGTRGLVALGKLIELLVHAHGLVQSTPEMRYSTWGYASRATR